MRCILLASLILFVFVPRFCKANCRGYQCYHKASTSFSSPTLGHFAGKTCAFSMSCSRANDRVPSRCGGTPSSQEQRKLCDKVLDSSKPFSLADVYVHGKADCKANSDTNAWMTPKKVVCCARFNNQNVAYLC